MASHTSDSMCMPLLRMFEYHLVQELQGRCRPSCSPAVTELAGQGRFEAMEHHVALAAGPCMSMGWLCSDAPAYEHSRGTTTGSQGLDAALRWLPCWPLLVLPTGGVTSVIRNKHDQP